VNFSAITLRVSSQGVFVVVYFVIDSALILACASFLQTKVVLLEENPEAPEMTFLADRARLHLPSQRFMRLHMLQNKYEPPNSDAYNSYV
jgi:hypothetical protein